jgi:methionyl-tRNA synthetase
MKKSFYLTTTLPYVNAEAHMGHALEFIRADAISRYKHLTGHEVLFNTGADEHGQKIYEKAMGEGKDPQEFVDIYARKLKDLGTVLGLKKEDKENGYHSNFIRTTDEKHIKAATEFWNRCSQNGYIYKKKYKGLYCISDEIFLKEKDLVNGRCPDHQDKELVEIEEENYFFKYSAFEEKLLEMYESNPEFVVPSNRFNEIKAFVKRGLEDFSISRLKSKMPWGVPVPGDDEHVMYVWFDALVSYISTLGWPDDEKSFDKWWVNTGGVVQYCGKDNLQHQGARWQAMLMSVGLPPSKKIVVNGFILGEGNIKMSKSVGNVVDPLEIVNEYGTDALRYFLLREVSQFEDSAFTKEHFKEIYNASLANGLGNLASRILKMAENYQVWLTDEEKNIHYFDEVAGHDENMERYDIKAFADLQWNHMQLLDEHIQKEQPFKKIKTDPEGAKKDVHYLLVHLLGIALKIEPLLPEASMKIRQAILENKMPAPIFKRKD